MSNGKRRAANPGRSDETRIAPEEDEDATRDLPLLERPEETHMGPVVDADATGDISLPYRPEETRMAPLEPEEGAIQTRLESQDARPVRGGRARVPAPPGRGSRDAPPGELGTEVRGRNPQADIRTEVRGQKAPVDPSTEVRGHRAPVDVSTELRPPKAPVELSTEVRSHKAPMDVSTDIMSPKPAAARGGKEGGKAAGWLARGGEKKAGAAPPAVGVVRLSPLEPAKGKVAAAEDESPALRTMFANHSALLAEQFRSAMASKMYGRGPHRVLRIDEPEGPSTAGGKLARQAISLVPRKGSGPSVMCGWVDVSKREAQLRNFDAAAKRYESHHGEPLEMQPEEYERFLADVEEVLVKAVIKVRIIVPEEVGAVRIAPSTQARRKGVPVLLAVTLAVLAFVLGLYLGRMPPG
ncbi:hypothetical protein [Pyxidicoccus xibeiensis]|uniref:hypothetical protein n=1 Tax=Pyxidicoccus xibeiensis TaxID=2906759 RepID=UPI0020A82CF6|nr:hypothetical protein [Pyxidicoccus xibeiensis]MCP3141494.1 hypothetical protein [Pyxidicoccus xibeiensis]